MLCAFVAMTFAVPMPEEETIPYGDQPLVEDIELVSANDDLEGAEHRYGGYGGYGRGYGGYGE